MTDFSCFWQIKYFDLGCTDFKWLVSFLFTDLSIKFLNFGTLMDCVQTILWEKYSIIFMRV